uniref:Putative salivary lipocalin n=1 Tax=Ixodes ricinus TaxID=34613 RepID=A0A0K8RFK1_IXORI
MKHAYWLISLYFFAVLVDAKPGDVRVDEDPNYWGYQDIKKALSNKDNKSWMVYRTLRSTDRAKHKCVYAEVKEKEAEENAYEFVQKYLKEDGTTEKQTLYAIPYKTEHPEGKDRKIENAMRVTKNKGSKTGRHYRLIFSDYKCCDILRALEDEKGAACELYLHDQCVGEAVSRKCELQYEKACGKGEAYKHEVYYPSCRNTTDVTPKPTTKPPDHEETPEKPTPEVPQTPEETTTTSTLPPGC